MSSAQPLPAAHRSLSILVVDDSPEFSSALAERLREEQHVVCTAASGREATAILHSVAVDVVITDILMADGDGLELIRAARIRTPAPRIIAMSGGGRFVTATDCLKTANGFGADMCLLKPFSTGELLAALGPVNPPHRPA